VILVYIYSGGGGEEKGTVGETEFWFIGKIQPGLFIANLSFP